MKDENGCGLLCIVCFLLLLYLLEHKKPGGENHEKQWKQIQKRWASVQKQSREEKSEHTEAKQKMVMTKNWNLL